MFAQEEPVRHNRQQPEQSPQPDAAESARVIAGMLAPSPGGLLLSSPDVVHRGSFSSYNSSGNLSSFNGEQRKKFKIYYCLEMATVARELVSLDDRFVLAEVQWDHFPDGQRTPALAAVRIAAVQRLLPRRTVAGVPPRAHVGWSQHLTLCCHFLCVWFAVLQAFRTCSFRVPTP